MVESQHFRHSLSARQDGKWVCYSENDQTISYWLEGLGNTRTRAHVVQGGPGSLRTLTQIDFRILKKRVKIDGIIREIEVLDVLAVGLTTN